MSKRDHQSQAQMWFKGYSFWHCPGTNHAPRFILWVICRTSYDTRQRAIASDTQPATRLAIASVAPLCPIHISHRPDNGMLRTSSQIMQFLAGPLGGLLSRHIREM
ncbi:MAG: hypothetical protein ICV63_01075 [Coleofasciculus sp. Co-bin14]|nr:hypothetical protein [Coleofasciculus sp. Co-bin14]